MNWYGLKRTSMRPLTAWRRRQIERRGEFNPAVFEALDYRPSLRRFSEAARADPNILVDADLRPGAVVFDVGAFEGRWTERLLQHLDGAGSVEISVHAFEPVLSALDDCRNLIGDDQRVHLHPYGLSGRDRVASMTVRGPGSSVFDDPHSADLGTSDVELRDIASVLSSLQVERVDLMKINIEGGEYELLDRLHETGWLPRIKTIIVQFHEFVPGAYGARRRNRRQLAETHKSTWDYAWVFERWDRV